MSVDDTEHLAHICRVIALEDAVLSLLREFNRTAAPDEQATAITVDLDAEGRGDLTYMRGSFPVMGVSL